MSMVATFYTDFLVAGSRHFVGGGDVKGPKTTRTRSRDSVDVFYDQGGPSHCGGGDGAGI